MGDIKNTKRRQKTLMSMIMKAVWGIGFGILGLTICILIFLSEVTKRHLFTAEVFTRMESTIVIGYFCIVVSMIFFIPFLTARKLKRKGQSILEVTEKIKEQDLNFIISSSGVKEIDQVLNGMDDMRMVLKEALETQWRMEQNRKNQISALAHDFKTPITVLKGNMDLLRVSDLDDICKDYVEDATISLEQIELYLDQLLQMTRAEKGYVVKNQKIELGSMLDEEGSILARIADEKEITIAIEKQEDAIYIFADFNLLRRVFHNLISNAIDFTPQKGSIKIILIAEENSAVITITDTGCGFSQNALKHGMEQFYMDDSSRGRKNHYGLGLYIVDTIMKLHNGSIQLTNDEITGGARIIIKIPLMIEK
jgi:Signal transduction histidine kinase